MGSLSRDEQAEEAAKRMIEYYQKLERIIAWLVVRYGEPHPGGWRYLLNDEDAGALDRLLDTVEPVVIMTHEDAAARYVIDVL